MKLSLLKAKRTTEILQSRIRECSVPLKAYAVEAPDCKSSNTAPEGEYMPFSLVDDKIRRYWVKLSFDTPKAQADREYYLELSTGIGGTEAQLILYLNGRMAEGMDNNHRRAILAPDTHYEAVIYFYSGQPWAHYNAEFSLTTVNKRTEKLYFDMAVPFEACRDVYTEESYEYQSVLACLEGACNILDLRAPGSLEFLNSVEKAIDYMDKEFYTKLCSANSKPSVSCVGHTHIDVEWMWDRRQTKEKMQRSISTALSLMKQYPEYLFMLSQPELFRYLKEEAPEKYEEMKKYISEGRFEPEGALYLECDCNLTSGESLVRQLLYGKKFFSEEFGIDSRICFLPDVFGYSAAMPQILKKSEVDYFVTSKISWNDTNTVPYDVFIWKGIDNSEIFSSFITGQQYKKRSEPKRRTAYGSGLDPAFIKGAWERFQQKEYCSSTLFTFGHGDGGGGPTYQMLEHQRRLAKGLPGMPKTSHVSLRGALDRLKKEFNASAQKLRQTPAWSGELYLELHRGTYTSQAQVKRANRKAELGISVLEALSVLDVCFGGKYNKETIDSLWRVILHQQFHDILPGSSINDVYKLVAEDYKQLFAQMKAESDAKLSSIRNKLNTEGGILVFNPLGYERSGEINIDGTSVNTKEKIPAFGYKVIKAPAVESKVVLCENTAENPYYRLTLDGMGHITSLYDKKADREVILSGKAANEFLIYEDYPDDHDAWDMEEYTQRKEYRIEGKADIEPITDGERAGFLIRKCYRDSVIEQRLWLYSHNPRIDIENRILWTMDHHILKLSFPVDIRSDEVKCEIQFGHTSRPTHRNTSWDEAKFEICAQKWIDISEYGYGVALLNDCKYGHSVEDSTLKLTCIKCPTEPDAKADLGEHIFTCSLMPHSGDFRDAGVIREAYNLNQPLIAIPVEKNKGSMPDCFSPVSTDNPAVMPETVKLSEDGEGIVVRLYESFGGKAKCRLNLADVFGSAYETNLMEQEPKPLELTDNTIELTFKPFEIKTILLRR